jgi:hypothetical protein
MMMCLVCLEPKETLHSTFVCADCVAMSSERAAINMEGRHLIRALRTLGIKHRIHEPQTDKVQN